MKRPGEQLKMFMSPTELKALHPQDADNLPARPGVWPTKSRNLAETDEGQDLAASIRKHGVREPVKIGEEYSGEGTDTLYDGHHRTQAAEEAGQAYVPVTYRW